MLKKNWHSKLIRLFIAGISVVLGSLLISTASVYGSVESFATSNRLGGSPELLAPNESVLHQAAESLDLTRLNQFIQELDNDVNQYLPRLDPKSWGVVGPDWNLAAIGKGILRYFIREVVFNLRLLGELLLIVMALAVLQNLQHAFESETVNQVAFGLCFLIVIGIVFNSYRVTFQVAGNAVKEMANFMYAIIPLLFSLIAAGGGVTTVTIVHPLLVSTVNIVTVLVQTVIFPLILFSGILGMVNFMISSFQINKLANFLKNMAIGLMGLVMTLFIGIISIRGFSASVGDSMALRTAKYFSNTFLPVVGGAISDTMEMATGCSMILKSGLGIFGLGLVVLITVFPLLKILAVAVIYHLSSAVIQPLGDLRMADALQAVGQMFLNLFGALAVVGLMFFISISILVGIANFGFR